MNHEDHVNLLLKAIPGPGGTWADLGSGTGAFTLALADLLGPSAHIYTVDRDKSALREQERAMRARFPAITVQYIAADFTRRLDLPPLDGIVMANSLHFVREKNAVVQLIRSYLRPGGRLILVEYDADRGNMWVPYPLSYGARASQVGEKCPPQTSERCSRTIMMLASHFPLSCFFLPHSAYVVSLVA